MKNILLFQLPYVSLDFDHMMDSSDEELEDDEQAEEPKDLPLHLLKREFLALSCQ